ncbi:hypothetical protein B0T19DRAFT_148375 [Cercophora scortea]|uniref:Uncharacterized protein n=1 Tax=Cercophora scortea TaxID=314031 RepID=A0AAE0MKA6_9PEZI|nr:hypothetical protein B0T19DRAFT_148375 [Cercophora scortea]
MNRRAIWAAALMLLAGDGFAVEADAGNTDVQAFFGAHQNDTEAFSTEIAPPWVPSPNSRGTINILWSCIVTLIACVYTALHLNIPASNERGTARMLLRKAQWVVMTLMAPEIILYVALMQFIEARALMKGLRVVLKKEKAMRPINADEDMINMKYCFFVVMGGLQVSIDDIYPSEYVRGTTVRVPHIVPLSTDGVMLLAECGHLEALVVPPAKIEDRSKANIIQKALVLTQVGWMALQCIVKKAQGYPISLLEIHTFVHVVCAVALYTLWVEKPLDIREPEIITETTAFEDILALMVQEQYCILQNASTILFPPRTAENESQVFAAELRDEEVVSMRFEQEGNAVRVIWKDDASVLRDGEALPCGFGYLKQLSDEELEEYKGWTADHIRLEASDRLRAERVVKHLLVTDSTVMHYKTGRTYNQGFAILGHLYRYPHGDYRTAFSSGGHFTYRVAENRFINNRNLRSDDSYLDRVTHFFLDLVGGFAFTNALHFLFVALLPALYGGIHLSAWNSVFPSHVESILWKASCLIIMVTIPAVWVALLVSLMSALLADHREPSRVSGSTWWRRVFAILKWYVLLSMVVYASARAFIIVEAFLSTRHMPYGVYYIPSWLQIFPHL